jgi:hypothetical protein
VRVLGAWDAVVRALRADRVETIIQPKRQPSGLPLPECERTREPALAQAIVDRAALVDSIRSVLDQTDQHDHRSSQVAASG